MTKDDVTNEMLEAVEMAIGMGHGAWDMVDPKELIAVIVTLSRLEIVKLCQRFSHSGCNPDTHALAYKVLVLAGEREEVEQSK